MNFNPVENNINQITSLLMCVGNNHDYLLCKHLKRKGASDEELVQAFEMLLHGALLEEYHPEFSLDLLQVELMKNNNINEQNSAGNAPIHIASVYHDVRLLELLIKLGADVNAISAEGYTPLHKAIMYNSWPAVEVLMSADADPIRVSLTYPTTPLVETFLDDSLECFKAIVLTKRKLAFNLGGYLRFCRKGTRIEEYLHDAGYSLKIDD